MKDIILNALIETQSQRRAADKLGITRKKLVTLMSEYKIKTEHYVDPNFTVSDRIKAAYEKKMNERLNNELSRISKDLLLTTILSKITKSDICKELNIELKQLPKLISYYGLNYNELISHQQVQNARIENYKKTMLKKYGVDNSFKKPDVIEKIQTKNKKNRSQILEKMKNTLIKNYGVDHPMKSKEIVERMRLRYNEKHGVNHQWANEDVKDAIKQTNIKTYGVDHPMKDPEIQNKKQETNKERYGSISPLGNSDIRKKAWNSYYKNGRASASKQEKEVVDFIKSIYQGEIIENSKNLIYPNELDIYIPEHRLAIEFNGSYWHSIQMLGDDKKDIHFKKSKLCEEKGIRLIHVFEFYWEDPQKRKIYESIIRNALKLDIIKVRASKTELKKITANEARNFLNENHMSGFVASKHIYGLYLEDELIHVEVFGKPRFNKNFQWESIRGCSKIGYMIYGGYEKVLKHFIRETNAKSIVSYVDFNIFNGQLHDNAGFKFIGYTGPDRWYMDENNIVKRYWIIRGNNPKDLEWDRIRNENKQYDYYFAGSKTYGLIL